MGPKPHPKPLHLAVGVILAVAVAVAAESRAHSYGLALRTVRESLGMQSLWLGGALAFAVLFTVLASWRVGRGWLLLAPPALAAGSALAAGHLEAAQQAARATTALTMGQRAAVLALGLVRPAGFAGLGLLVASALLAWAALVVASRAHAPPLPGPRRALALLVGVLAIGGVAVALPSWHRAVGWIGASPAIVGVVAVYVASARLARSALSGAMKNSVPRPFAQSASSSSPPSNSSRTFSMLKTVPLWFPASSQSQNAGQKSQP